MSGAVDWISLSGFCRAVLWLFRPPLQYAKI